MAKKDILKGEEFLLAASGRFQINDIELMIPPSQIQVSKMNHANKVSNLRTSSEATIWSRNKEVHVNVKMFFTDKPRSNKESGFDDLRGMIAGLRATPFCFIENEFIRNSIVGGSEKGNDKSMVFALRSLNVSTASNPQTNSYMPGTLSVELNLSYFNYQAYVNEFIYHAAPFESNTVVNPKKSASWKIMRFAEERKRNYTATSTFTRESGSPLGKTTFKFQEFKMVTIPDLLKEIKVQEYKLKMEKEGLELDEEERSSRAREWMEDYDQKAALDADYTSSYEERQRRLYENKKDGKEGYHSSSSESSMFFVGGKKKTAEQILLEGKVDLFSKQSDWKLYKLKDGSMFKMEENPFKGAKEIELKKSAQDERYLVSRLRSIALGLSKLHVLGINVNITNRVTPLSLLGSETPTFQYLGGSDASVSISLKTTSKAALIAIISLEKLWYSQGNVLRVLPLKMRRINIINDFLNMCGLHNFLLDNISISTAPGEPECRYIHLDLSEKEFDGTDESFTYERFEMYKDMDMFKALLPIFRENIVFLKDQFSRGWFTNRASLKSRNRRTADGGWIPRQVEGGGVIGRGGNVRFDEEYDGMGSFGKAHTFLGIIPYASFVHGIKQDTSFGSKEKGYDRIYVPKEKNTNGISDHIYLDLLNMWSIIFSGLVEGLVRYLQVTESQNLLYSDQAEGAKRDTPTIDNMRHGEFFYTLYKAYKDEHKDSKFDTTGDKFIIEWEYKRWKFISEITEKELPSIAKARKDAISVLLDPRLGASGASYYKDLKNGKVRKDILYPFYAIADGNESDLVSLSDVEYKFDEMWEDLESQEFFVTYISRRNKFFRAIIEDESYLKVIGEVEPEFEFDLEGMSSRDVYQGSNAYPDMPISEAVEIIKETYGGALKNLEGELMELNKHLDGRFLSIPRLYGPDFYLYNPADSLEDIVGTDALVKAATNVAKGTATKPGKLNKYFKEVYKNRIGSDRYDALRKNRTELGKDEITHALELGLIDKEDEDNNMKGEYAPSDFGEIATPGLESSDVDHIAGDQDRMKPSFSLNNPTDEGILNLDAMGTDLTPEEMAAYGIPDFMYPMKKPRPPRPGHGFGADRTNFRHAKHEGTDTTSNLEKEIIQFWNQDTHFPKEEGRGWKVYAAADGWIQSISPKAGWEEREGVPFHKTIFGRKIYERYTWTDHYKKKYKDIDFDNADDVAKFRDQIKVGSYAWSRMKDKLYEPNHTITINHYHGWTTVYRHLKNTTLFHVIRAQFKAKKGSGTNITVGKGAHFAWAGNTGWSTGDHLHLELRKNGVAQDPWEFIINKNRLKSVRPKGDPSNENSVLKNIFKNFQKSTDASRGMIRAYPTFKLYFIESDADNRELFGFDDYFSYQAIQEIQLVRNADNPVDLCIIRLTNLSGNLTNRKFMDLKQGIGSPDSKANRGRPNPSQPINNGERSTETLKKSAGLDIDNELENPITSLLLKSGTQLQLRMGYSPNPDQLPILFNGVVMDIQYHGSDDMITITCQSYGMELAGNLQGFGNAEDGVEKKKTEFKDEKEGRTEKIIETLMSYPELKHFGRWQKSNSTGFGYIASDAEDDTAIRGKQKEGSSLVVDEWKLRKEIYGDNVYLPEKGMIGLSEGSPFIIYKSTIWDILQELTYRHPGSIAYPVPYQSNWGPSMTLYFGLPNGNYVCKDSSSSHKKAAQKLRFLKSKAYKTKAGEERARDWMIKMTDGALDPNSLEGQEEAKSVNWDERKWFSGDEAIGRDYVISRTLSKFADDFGLFKPFRNYHVLTNKHNIIDNSIISSTYSTFNSATIEYSAGATWDKEGASIDDGSKNDESKLVFGKAKTLTVKADAAIRDEEIREVYAGFPNCYGVEQAKRYGQSLLWKSMKQGYRGSIVILGDPNIKPYDICYIFDSFSETYGPIEVEQVIHKFSHQSGFVTEIVPRMCISTNEEASMSAMNAMGMIAEQSVYSSMLAKIIDPDYGDSTLGNTIEGAQQLAILGLGVGAAAVVIAATTPVAIGAAAVGLGGVGLVGYFFTDNMLLDPAEHGTGALDAIGLAVSRKIITRTQMEHLFEYTPLTVRGRPLLGGLPLFKKSWPPGSFIHSFIKDSMEFYEEGQRGVALDNASKDKLVDPNNHLDPL